MTEIEVSSLLPPFTAIRLVWARTGSFTDDPHSQLASVLAENSQKEIIALAKSGKDQNFKEYQYVIDAAATMDAGIRNLDIVYKGRQDNFKDNEKLRDTYLASIQDTQEFGKSLKDVLRSLPTMTIGSVSGIAFAEKILNIKGEALWGVGLGLAAVGYLVNLAFVRYSRGRKQRLFIMQDYERSMYYEQYVNRGAAILYSLYLDIDRIHKAIFGKEYPIGEKTVGDLIENILVGVRPTFCKYIHKHMRDDKITPELWVLCETGNPEETKNCPIWKTEK